MLNESLGPQKLSVLMGNFTGFIGLSSVCENIIGIMSV